MMFKRPNVSSCTWMSRHVLSQVKGLVPAIRQSQRLQKVNAENTGLTDFPDEGKMHAGEEQLNSQGSYAKRGT